MTFPRWTSFSIFLAVAVGCVGSPGKARAEDSTPAKVSIAEIQSGIELHIAQLTEAGSGWFHLQHDDRELNLKLVRVHTEYLAQLGPNEHFACVDLVNDDGQVYDVDFFLTGRPGAMAVTRTLVHKLNGQPYYTWEQTADGGWRTVEVDLADDRLLGVVSGTDRFDFIYRATLPELGDRARMWLPLPASDAYQSARLAAIDAPGQHRVLTDQRHGNQVLFLELERDHGGAVVELRFEVERREKSAYRAEPGDLGAYLNPERLVPDDERFGEIAREVVAGKDGDLARARALYDHVIDTMSYMKYGTGWGQGNAVYACDTRTGNCSDFHAYFIALARAVNIPARFAIGASIPSERNDGGIDGYHCWAEFFADGQWWPVDISEANKHSRLASYYFGNHPATRIELSRGRDLVVDPGPKSGPINFLAYPVLEVDGKPVRVAVQFAFVRR